MASINKRGIWIYFMKISIKQSTQSKFKVGDWVIYIGKGYRDGEILQITNIDEKDFCSFDNYNKLLRYI